MNSCHVHTCGKNVGRGHEHSVCIQSQGCRDGWVDSVSLLRGESVESQATLTVSLLRVESVDSQAQGCQASINQSFLTSMCAICPARQLELAMGKEQRLAEAGDTNPGTFLVALAAAKLQWFLPVLHRSGRSRCTVNLVHLQP